IKVPLDVILTFKFASLAILRKLFKFLFKNGSPIKCKYIWFVYPSILLIISLKLSTSINPNFLLVLGQKLQLKLHMLVVSIYIFLNLVMCYLLFTFIKLIYHIISFLPIY